MLQILSQLGIVFCLIVGELRQKHLPSLFRLYTIQAWFALGVEIASISYQHYLPNRSNHIVYNLYMPFDFILLFLAGYGFLERKSKLFHWIGISVYFLVWVASLFIQGLNTMANFSVICGALFLTIRYIQVLIWNTRQPAGPVTTGIYFIAVSILIYYCCMIPLFSLMHYFIREDPTLATRLFSINSALSALRYFGAGVGILVASRAFRSNTAVHV